jgi:VanZ family protein
VKLKSKFLTLIKIKCQAKFQQNSTFLIKPILSLPAGLFLYYFNIRGQVVCSKDETMIDEATLQHFILGMIMALSYPTFRRFKYSYLALILIHPFVIEGVQFFMPSRTPDAADVLVGLVGTLLGFCLV